MSNKDPETDIGVQPEDQKSKSSQATRELFELFKLKESQSSSTLYSSLVLGLKVCTTTAWPVWLPSVTAGLKMCAPTAQPLWLASVTAGIKGVCHPCLACMAD